REYYQLFAIFNNADEPNLPLPTPEQQQQSSELQQQLKTAEAKLKEYDTKAAKRQGEWEAQLAQSADAVQWQVLKPAEAQSTGGATLTELDDHSLLASGTIPRSDTYVVRLPAAGQAVTAIRLEALTHP